MSNILYPYDPTGTAPTNRVVTSLELPRVRNRALAPDGAPFYKDSVEITLKETGALLPKASYEVLMLHSEATAATGMSVATIINITDENFYGEIEVAVQVVGGSFINNAAVIERMLETLASDNRSIRFSDLIDVPVTMPPSPHLTYVGDLYGAKSLVDALDRITESNTYSTNITIELLNDRYDRIYEIIQNLSETGGSAGVDLELLKQQVANNLIATNDAIRQLTTTVESNDDARRQDVLDLLGRITAIDSKITSLELKDISLQQAIDALSEDLNTLSQDIDVSINGLTAEIAKVAVAIVGPTALYQGDEASWEISNYDSFTEYSINSVIPGFELTDTTITGSIGDDVEAGTHILQVTKGIITRDVPIEVLPKYVVKPTITWVVEGQEDVTLSPSLTLSEFLTIPVNADTFGSVQWQFAMDVEFDGLVSDEVYSTESPTMTNTLPLETTLYARARVKGTDIKYSEWSDTVSFTTVGIKTPTMTISGATFGQDEEGRTRYTHEFEVALSAYEGGGTHTATMYQIRSETDELLYESGAITAAANRRKLKPYNDTTLTSDTTIKLYAKYRNSDGAWGSYNLPTIVTLCTREEVEYQDSSTTSDSRQTEKSVKVGTVPRPTGQTRWYWTKPLEGFTGNNSEGFSDHTTTSSPSSPGAGWSLSSVSSTNDVYSNYTGYTGYNTRTVTFTAWSTIET